MDLVDVLKMFENRCAERSLVSVDEAICGLASWIATRHRILTEDDVALLTSIGALLFAEGAVQVAARRDAIPDDVGEMVNQLIAAAKRRH